MIPALKHIAPPLATAQRAADTDGYIGAANARRMATAGRL
jgi:hypothetical protein